MMQKLNVQLEDWEENSLRTFLGEPIEFHKFRQLQFTEMFGVNWDQEPIDATSKLKKLSEKTY